MTIPSNSLDSVVWKMWDQALALCFCSPIILRSLWANLQILLNIFRYIFLWCSLSLISNSSWTQPKFILNCSSFKVVFSVFSWQKSWHKSVYDASFIILVLMWQEQHMLNSHWQIEAIIDKLSPSNNWPLTFTVILAWVQGDAGYLISMEGSACIIPGPCFTKYHSSLLEDNLICY